MTSVGSESLDYLRLDCSNDPLTADLGINGTLLLTNIKSGTTQAAAGAVANELWKTNGHATLPDNVVMIGV